MRRVICVVAAVCLALAGCGVVDPSASDRRPATPVASDFNAVDVMFLQMMIPHHRQGLQIVRLVRDRTVRPEVTTLAKAIEATQTTEVGTMTAWLRATGKPTSADPDSHGDHAHLHTTDPAAIDALATVGDAEFEGRFLDLLIAHQRNAAEMARQEIRGGKYPDTVAFARRVDQPRTAQVRMMRTLLNG